MAHEGFTGQVIISNRGISKKEFKCRISFTGRSINQYYITNIAVLENDNNRKKLVKIKRLETFYDRLSLKHINSSVQQLGARWIS